MAACPAGHDSASDDFCDVCGTRIGGSRGSSPGRPTGRHHGLDRGAANRGLTCPGCGAPVSGMFCEACGFSHRARRSFAPPVPPADPFTSGPPPASPSSGPPESLFPPVSKPGSPPWERMEPPSSWSPPEPPPSSWSPPEPPPSSWSRPEPPPALGGRPEPPPFPPVQPSPPDEAADSAVTDLLASLFSPVAPPHPEPSSFPASPLPEPGRTVMRPSSRGVLQPHPQRLYQCSVQSPGPC